MTRSRTTLIVSLWRLVLVAAAGAIWLWRGGPAIQQQVLSDLGQGGYTLTATDGTPFTQAYLAGQPTAVFFGFTHGPEVCPTTLGDIGVWQEEPAAAGEAPMRVFFATVDPERDTADVRGDYVSWVPDVTGITRSREQIDEAIRAFRI